MALYQDSLLFIARFKVGPDSQIGISKSAQIMTFSVRLEATPAKFCSINWRCSRTVLEHLELF